MEKTIRIGVSGCLLGQRVRYDGGHKYNPFLVEILGTCVEYLPLCPEAESGLTVPRDPIRLKGDPLAPRLTFHKTGEDVTERVETWARGRMESLAREDLCGFVFKSRSPSCALEGMKVYGPTGLPKKGASGLFARLFRERFPRIPVEDEERLGDPSLREGFIERIFAYRRWKDLLSTDPSPADLIAFHSRHKLQLMAHSVEELRILGRLVAGRKESSWTEVLERYEALFLDILKKRSTVKRNTNVLQHMAGYFKKSLSPEARQDLSTTIDRYRLGTVPLIVPATLICHYVRLFKEPYLIGQTYLEPTPEELKLRNHG